MGFSRRSNRNNNINKLRQEKNEEGETVATRMMRQVVSLPEGCDEDAAVETSFEEGGVLAISIPRKTEAIEADMTPEVTKETQETKEAPQDATQEAEEGAEKNLENH